MHVIRLRAAWRNAGDGCHVRKFHRPTGLEGGARVWLAWDGPASDIRLNGEPLDVETSRVEVTQRLRHTNEVSLATSDEACLQTVRLEIGGEGPDAVD